jgi:RNA-directed DNA polymerase
LNANGIKLLLHSSTEIVRHTKVKGVKGNASPYDRNTMYWAKRRGKHPETLLLSSKINPEAKR